MSGNHDEINGAGSKGGVDGGVGNKRTALAGQWETPPTFTMYPSLQSKQHHQHHHQHQQMPNTITSGQGSMPVTNLRTPANIPDSSEEYAKALEDAYRQGAQAAAIMAQQQQIPTAASCPNFSTDAGGSLQSPRLSRTQIGVSSVEEELAVELDHKIHPSPPQNHAAMSRNKVVTSAVPDTLCSAMPPPPPPSGHVHIKTQQSQPFASISHQAPYHMNEPNPHLAVALTPSQAETTMTNTTATTTNTVIASRPPVKSQIPGRSLSMPDMSSYTAEAEEEKRLKRLARNRHSARLRRLKKKNLVDAYETEVGILEKALKQLKAHEWGKNNDDHKAILDALSMERGQQELSADQRTEIIQDILKQQMQQITMLQEAQREQEFLVLLASHEENVNGNDDDEIFHELQNILNLTPEQKEKIRESSKGLDKEVEALDTVSASLRAMQENKWLLNEGAQKITEEFTSILHKNQKSKLLLWTDSNAEAVDQLDYVQVQPLQNAPIFTFGAEAASAGDDE